ncbi:hypothetical protein GCM10018773_19880 [Streptomyces candidus]|nr:hypothetical protein GCM10018773_19880 [Streptomyces candidus]
MRRTTDPLDSPAVTSPALPLVASAARSSVPAPCVRGPPRSPEAAVCHQNAPPRTHPVTEMAGVRKWLQEEMSKKRHGVVQVRRVHVHLPLHLLYAFGTMVRAHV